MYCVRCKTKTETNNIIQAQIINNRKMLNGICNICGSRKSTFVSNKTGEGFNLNNLINNLPIELHQFVEKGEDVPNGSFNNLHKYSYCGPGTRYNQRIREGYNGINELDRNCKLHDQFYNENTDTKTKNISDVVLAHRAEEIARNPIYDEQQRKDHSVDPYITGLIIATRWAPQ